MLGADLNADLNASPGSQMRRNSVSAPEHLMQTLLTRQEIIVAGNATEVAVEQPPSSDPAHSDECAGPLPLALVWGYAIGHHLNDLWHPELYTDAR